MNKKITAVVFLDVDGVLNTLTTCANAPSKIHIGVDEARIILLAKAMKETYTDGVVLTSTWKEMREDDEDYIYRKARNKCSRKNRRGEKKSTRAWNYAISGRTS